MSSFTSPLTFYVVFHPGCAKSRALADDLFRWFRMQQDGDESRREVELAREPRPLDDTGQLWTVQPAVAIHAEAAGFSRPMAPLSQVVHVGWEPEASGEGVEQVVDRLLLEVLLAEFYRRLCRSMAPEVGADTVLLTFAPDPWTFTRLTGALRKRPNGLPVRIGYPGFGLRSGELEGLVRLAEDLGYPNGTRFVTLEELREPFEPHPIAPAAARPIAALSAGGDLLGMAPWGAGPIHADDLVVRLSRRLLRAGWRLAYGGTLARIETNITRSLIAVATGYAAERERAAGVRRTTRDHPPPRISTFRPSSTTSPGRTTCSCPSGRWPSSWVSAASRQSGRKRSRVCWTRSSTPRTARAARS